jgi:hypothetical protein
VPGVGFTFEERNKSLLMTQPLKKIKIISGNSGCKLPPSVEGDNSMLFDHVPVPGNPPLKASFCLSCGMFIAASGETALLIFIELKHVCPERRRRSDLQLADTQRSPQNPSITND